MAPRAALGLYSLVALGRRFRFWLTRHLPLRSACPLASRLEFLSESGESFGINLERRANRRVLELLRPLAFLVSHSPARSCSGCQFGIGEVEGHGRIVALLHSRVHAVRDSVPTCTANEGQAIQSVATTFAWYATLRSANYS